jgi:4-amino-4-deoxy-L-arabinose transferase-like glycosyltransferase
MSNSAKYYLYILMAGIALSLPFIGSSQLFDWDEINFAECAREMLVTGNYQTVQINFQPFWEKPPLFIWMQALSMNIFGINEFAARLPNALCGIITLLVLFRLGKKYADERFGLLWALAYAGSILPQLYFKSGIIDPWFNLFIFCGIYFLMLYTDEAQSNKKKHILLSAIFIGLAIMTKGPAALLIVALCAAVFFIVKRFKYKVVFTDVLLFLITVVFVGSIWFMMLWLTGNKNIITEFFIYQVRLFNTQDAGHGGPFVYHFIVLLLGCFPASVFFLSSFRKNNEHSKQHFKTWMSILFWMVLILFSVVKTKIIHYSSLCYFPLSFLACYAVYHKIAINRYQQFLIYFILVAYLLLLAAVPFINTFKPEIINSGIIKDTFATEALNAEANWTVFHFIPAILFFITILVFAYYNFRKEINKSVIALFVMTMLSANTVFLFIIPNVDNYSQSAAVDFFKSLRDKDCYVSTLGYKSYAQLFYSNKPLPANKNSLNEEWLLTGAIDKPVYFSSKLNSEKEVLEKYTDIKVIGKKNGFVFYLRMPEN